MGSKMQLTLGHLPRELRDRVYSYLGEPGFEGWLKPVGIPKGSANILSCKSPPPIESLLVCRQMKDEILEHMYRNCTFTLVLDHWTSESTRNIYPLKIRYLRPILSHTPFIQHLNVRVLAYEGVASHKLIPLFVHKGINIRSLAIHLRFVGLCFVPILISVIDAIASMPRSYGIRIGSVGSWMPEQVLLEESFAEYEKGKVQVLEAIDRANVTKIERTE